MSPLPADLPAFLLTALVIEATPGPNMAWLAIVSATEGRRAGLAAVAGVSLGLLIVGLVVAAGLGAAIAGAPELSRLLRLAGVFYLFWLAFDAFAEARETSPEKYAGAAGAGGVRHFIRGLTVNLLNPKAALFYVATLPGFIDLAAPAAPQTTALTLAYVGVATIVHIALVCFAGAARARLDDAKKLARARQLGGVLLVLIALWFMADTRPL